MKTIKKTAAIICYVIAVVTLITSQCFAQSYQGTGNNFGSGWQSDGNGGYVGTGDNFGGGWRSDGNGGYVGTGDNFGGGWRR